ncbi:MAG: sel1 repeat family protein [Lachnospiraceae bacterium]|nr:sel1 repeat family protein [Lachnospiraceae bacterium]
MTGTEAVKALHDYYDIANPTEDDDFICTEALGFLIEKTKDPKYMCELGWHYCAKKRFDLEIRYLEMAAECGYLPALEELGYMWYYGQHGEQDYKKAFYYFSRGVQDKGTGSLWCRYKLADMYRNGYAVEKDEAKAREIIEEAWEQVKEPRFFNEPFPEIAHRLAEIREADGDREEAVRLLRQAKRFLAERIRNDPFWGYFSVMKRIVTLLYRLTPFDPQKNDLYDLFYLLETPGTCVLRRGRQKFRIDAEETEESPAAVRFDGRWYRNVAEFCQKAAWNGEKLTENYDEYCVGEVIR